MGCVSLCDSKPSDVIKPSKKTNNAIVRLISELKSSSLLPRAESFHIFCDRIQENSKEYTLAVQFPIKPDTHPPQKILQKWLLIILGRDLANKQYLNCLDLSRKQTQRSHGSLMQIQKDINRTFSFTQKQSSLLQRVLLRIASHFPSMGYTQGVNFIVGYLILLKFSQEEVFWIFVHLSLNQQYLLLGLFEDGLPLTYVLCHLFRRVLQRVDPTLYGHLFTTLQLDDSMWIFKWFITCFLYSLPLESVAHVWDHFIQRGTLSLVTFAISLVNAMRNKLLSLHDAADISEFLKQIKDLKVFNKTINIKQVMKKAEDLELKESDYEGIEECNGGFYGKYYSCKAKKNQEQCSAILCSWYKRLIEERSMFGSEKKLMTSRNNERDKSLSKCMEELEKSFIEFSESMGQSHRSIDRHSIIFEQVKEVVVKEQPTINKDGSEDSTKVSAKPHNPSYQNKSMKFTRKHKSRNDLLMKVSQNIQPSLSAKECPTDFIQQLDKITLFPTRPRERCFIPSPPSKNMLINAASQMLNTPQYLKPHPNKESTPQLTKQQSLQIHHVALAHPKSLKHQGAPQPPLQSDEVPVLQMGSIYLLSCSSESTEQKKSETTQKHSTAQAPKDTFAFPERVFKKKIMRNVEHPYEYEESCQSVIAASFSILSQNHEPDQNKSELK